MDLDHSQVLVSRRSQYEILVRAVDSGSQKGRKCFVEVSRGPWIYGSAKCYRPSSKVSESVFVQPGTLNTTLTGRVPSTRAASLCTLPTAIYWSRCVWRGSSGCILKIHCDAEDPLRYGASERKRPRLNNYTAKHSFTLLLCTATTSAGRKHLCQQAMFTVSSIYDLDGSPSVGRITTLINFLKQF